MKKTLSFLCLFAILLMPFSVMAGVRMPAQRGALTDDANVLSRQTAADITEYAELVSDETDLELNVAIVHFLDGLDAQTYAARLFENWQLDDNAVLLLTAAGEDSFATVMGSEAEKVLGRSNAENLMYTSSDFAALIRTQQYDAAFAAYCLSFNELIGRQTGDEIRMGSLFGAQTSAVANVQAYGSQLWTDMMTAIEHAGEDYSEHIKVYKVQDEGLTAGGWIVLLILVVIVIRQSRPLKHAPRRKRRTGCGCSPLGWIIGLLGLGFLFHND